MKRLKEKRGSTIIEVLIAATLIATAVLAGLSLSSSSQKQTDFSRDINAATDYNNQAIDWLRSFRSQMGWLSLVNELDLDTEGSSVTYCLNSLPTTAQEFAALSGGSCDENNPADKIGSTQFLREIDLTMSGSPVSRIDVAATTYWSGKLHSTKTEGVLTSW